MDQIKAVGESIGAMIFRKWLAVAIQSGALHSATTAASVVAPHPTPPIGTPSALTQGGNSTPARSLVPGLGESPAFSPVEGL